MIAGTPVLDLDDDASLQAADRGGILRSAASGGAQVRATATALEEGVLSGLAGMRPRSVVVVTGSGRASRAAALVVAAVGDQIGIPITTVPGIPPWTGPLDVVVVAGDDPAEPRLVESIDQALHRGAEVVVAAPTEGPLLAVAAGRAMVLEPRIAVLQPHQMVRYLAVLVGLLQILDAAGQRGCLPDLSELADELDAEALRDSPPNEVFHNPAKTLATQLRGSSVVLTGDTPAATELARHSAETLLSTAAQVATAVDLADAAAAAPRMIAAARTAGGPDYDPIFHDEQLDGPSPQRRRVFLLTAGHDELGARRKLAVFSGEGVLDTELIHLDSVATSDQTPPATHPEGALARLAVLTLRLDMAAAYLQLTSCDEGRF